ncbi:MAG TPA: hypothetical protein VE422_12360 [Terriglobia bacterium]|nr:hypothetical protein [Terriglobia bacterium]
MHAEDHFDDDFLMRLLRDPDELQRSGRERHFNACESCRDQLESYRRIQAFLHRESDFEVPRGWVNRMVKIFEAEEPGESSTASSKTFGWLLFDSLLADAAGIRAPARAATERHLIWESARFRVDLLIDSADPDQVVFIGQLVERPPGDDGRLVGATVEVTVGGRVFNGEVNFTGEFVVPVGRLTRGHPVEIHFWFAGALSVFLVIPS